MGALKFCRYSSTVYPTYLVLGGCICKAQGDMGKHSDLANRTRSCDMGWQEPIKCSWHSCDSLHATWVSATWFCFAFGFIFLYSIDLVVVMIHLSTPFKFLASPFARFFNSTVSYLQDLKELLDNSKLYLLRWADEYTDLVQGGFQELFTNLVDHFLFLCIRSVETLSSLDKSYTGQPVTPRLILLVSLLSVYIYQTAVPQITEVSMWFKFLKETSWGSEFCERSSTGWYTCCSEGMTFHRRCVLWFMYSFLPS
jgi:hypothetical protein